MNPAAVLSILVKTQGVSVATGQLASLNNAAAAAGASTGAMAKKTKGNFAAVANQSKYAALGIAGIAAAAVKTAADFQSSMNQLQAVSGVTTRELSSLRKEAIKLGADTKLPATSAKDAAEAMTEMVKAGVSVKDTMGGVRDVLVLSAAAGVSNARAAEIASNAMNAFGLKGKDVRKITDELANTANASSVEINDVADSFQMAAAVFSGFQSPAIGAKNAMTELNVAIGLLGNAGIKGSDAGTSLKQMMLQLTGPAQKTKNLMRDLYLQTGGSAEAQRLFTLTLEGTTKAVREKASVALEKLQGSTKGMGDIAYDASGKMRSLPKIIDQVSQATKGMTQEQKNQVITQIFGADATRSVIALMNAGPAAFDKMTKAVTKQGAAQDLANSKMKGLKGSFEALKSSLETLAISVGTVLLPPLEKIVRAMTALIPLVEKNKDVFAVLGATLVATAVGARALAVTMPLVTAGMAASTAAGGGFTGVLIGLRAAFLAIPVFAVIAGIAALVAALVIAYRQSEAFRNIVTSMGVAVTSAIHAVVGAVTSATNTVVNEVSQWDTLWSAIMRGLSIVKAAATLFFDGLKAIFSVGMLALGPVVVAAWTLIKGIFSGAWTAIKAIVTGGFNVLRGIVKVVGGLFKGDFSQVWDGIKTIFTGGITALKGILKGAWAILKAPVDALAAGIHDAFAHSWDRIKDLFRSSINTVIDFLNLLIKGINAIPGVPDIHAIGHIGGGGGGNKGPSAGDLRAAGFARGGAFGQTGGMVGKSMVFMGEDAPQHPEYVIPTNPAYRDRARGLLAQAAGAIGFAQGGVYSKSDLAALWSRVNPGLGNPNLMAAIALAESGGRAGAHNPSGASGLWQILGAPFPGNPFDPATNARMAGAKLRSQGLGAWEAYTNGAYKQFLGGGAGGGLSGLAGSVVHFLGSAVHSVGDIIGKLPHPKGLGMLQGLGEYVIGKVTGYVKDKAASLFTGGGGGVSGTVQDAIRIAASMGFAHPTAGQLTGGKHVAGSYHYQGRAADFGSAGHTVGEMTGLFNALRQRFGSHIKELFYDPIGYYIKNGARVPGAIGGHSDHIHIALARGGVWGGYGKGTGGAAPGMAWVGERGPELVRFKGGEQVFSHRDSLQMFGGYAKGTTAAKRAAKTARRQAAIDHATAVRIAKQRKKHVLDPQNPADVFWAKIHGIKIAPTKGLSSAQVASSASSIGGGGGGGDIGDGADPNQPLIDAINAAAEIQARLDDDIKAVKTSLDAQTAFAQSIQAADDYQLKKYLADILGGFIVGRGVTGRAFTPGTGVAYAYAPSVI